MLPKLSRTFLSLAFLITGIATSYPCEILRGKVVGVKDGDTIEVLVKNKPIVVRLFGVDAPEKRQAFGQKAKEFTSEKVFGKQVKVVVVSGNSYNRRVGEVFLNGVSLNEELVAAGLAWKDPRYSKSLGLEALQDRAKKERLGLWVDREPVRPWEFR